MRRFIMNGMELFLLLPVAVLVGILQFGAAKIAGNVSKTDVAVTCTVKSVEPVERVEQVDLKLDCGGKEASTHQAAVVLSHFTDPGPLTCTLYRSGRADCQPRKK